MNKATLTQIISPKPISLPLTGQAVFSDGSGLDFKKIREKYGDRPIRGIPIGLRPQHKPRV